MELSIIEDSTTQSSDLPLFVDVQDSDYATNEAQQPDTTLTSATETIPLLEDTQTAFTDINDKFEEEQQEVTETPTQHTSGRIKCPECIRYTATTEERMLRHVRKVHRGENPFQCYMCDYSTYNKAVFEEHVRIHQGIKPFKCAYCPYRSASKKNTKKHELRHRPDNPLKCPQCPFIGRHYRSLMCHREKMNHGNKCPDCRYVAKDDEDLQDHTNLHKSNKIFICSQCDARYPNMRALQAHKRLRKRCKECNIQLCTKHRLKQHLYTEHNVKVEESREYTFVCSICRWGGNSKARILLHLIHHPEQMVDETVIDVSILKQLEIMT
ncbi:zinc finger protein 64-like [Achroia grisella]|uniref:zinc finger protein 64-like n=1 Tax=Achroia grisella TaxID=688607 RepID=UPI0027D2A0A9|nr:zinc finger protein 64-like [Achroia grisella]